MTCRYCLFPFTHMWSHEKWSKFFSGWDKRLLRTCFLMTWSSIYFLQFQSQLTGLWGPWDRSTRFWCPRNQVKYKWVISALNSSEGTGRAWKLLHGKKPDPKWRRKYWKLVNCQKIKQHKYMHTKSFLPSKLPFSPHSLFFAFWLWGSFSPHGLTCLLQQPRGHLSHYL